MIILYLYLYRIIFIETKSELDRKDPKIVTGRIVAAIRRIVNGILY